MRKRIAISSLVLVGALLAGCSSNSTTESSSEPKKVEEEVPKPEEKKEEVKTVFAVGEKIQLGKSVVTVTGVQKSPGGEYDDPQEGNEFVIVNVKMENSGEENMLYNPYNFQIKNSKGQITDTAYTSLVKGKELNSGELATGGVVEGQLAFEAPVGDTGLQLIYQPNVYEKNY